MNQPEGIPPNLNIACSLAVGEVGRPYSTYCEAGWDDTDVCGAAVVVVGTCDCVPSSLSKCCRFCHFLKRRLDNFTCFFRSPLTRTVGLDDRTILLCVLCVPFHTVVRQFSSPKYA